MQSYLLGPARDGRLFLDHAVHQARRTERRGFLLHGARGLSIIVPIFVIAIVGFRGELKPLIYDLEKGTLAWAIAGGLALTVAVTSLFHALSLGPANVVVPIYGMFIVGGSLLGVLLLGEPMTWHKIVGLAAAVIGVVLISIYKARGGSTEAICLLRSLSSGEDSMLRHTISVKDKSMLTM